MPFYKFKRNDIFYNQLKTHPQVDLFIYTGSVYLNNEVGQNGTYSSTASGVPVGYVNLYEYNVNRDNSFLIYPFLTKNSDHTTFKTVTTASYKQTNYGTVFSGSYPMSATISSFYYPTMSGSGIDRNSPTKAANRRSGSYFGALENVLQNYNVYSPHFALSSTLAIGDDLGWDKGRQQMRFIDIPSIFYGSSIQKGSVSLKFLLSGTVQEEITDYYKDGVLRVTGSGNNSGKVAGVVLYNDGLVMLTGSWLVQTKSGSPHIETYESSVGADNPRWVYFGETGSAAIKSSFGMSFSGTNYVPNITMMAHAPKGHLNQSNNPTFIEYGQSGSMLAYTSSLAFRESPFLSIKNVTKSNFSGSSGSADFKKTTYISKIGIYDDNRNLIAIAKLATPVRKRETDDFTFKLKLDF